MDSRRWSTSMYYKHREIRLGVRADCVTSRELFVLIGISSLCLAPNSTSRRSQAVIELLWMYGIHQLFGSAANSNAETLERFQTKA